jgi:hypothetical protein
VKYKLLLLKQISLTVNPKRRETKKNNMDIIKPEEKMQTHESVINLRRVLREGGATDCEYKLLYCI